MTRFFTGNLINLNRLTNDEQNNTRINSVKTNVTNDKHSSASNKKRLFKLSTMMTQCLLLFALLLITVLAAVTGVYVVKINKLNKIIEKKDVIISTQQTNNKKSVEKIQMLTNQLNYTQQKLSMLIRIIYFMIYCLRITQCFSH
jgi:uncharacterized protein HemX